MSKPFHSLFSKEARDLATGVATGLKRKDVKQAGETLSKKTFSVAPTTLFEIW